MSGGCQFRAGRIPLWEEPPVSPRPCSSSQFGAVRQEVDPVRSPRRVSSSAWFLGLSECAGVAGMDERNGPASRLLRRMLGRTVLSTAPHGLLARIRWLFLLYALVSIMVNGAQVGLAETSQPFLPLCAVLGLAWLAWYLIRGCRHGHFPLVGYLGATGVLLVVGITLTNPAHLLTLVYASVFFRSLYGSPRRVVGWTGLAFAAMVGGAAWTGLNGGALDRGAIGLAVIQL